MEPTITACTSCGSTKFFVHELQIFDAQIDEASGTLEASNSSVYSDIETVNCERCGCGYHPRDFKQIDFC